MADDVIREFVDDVIKQFIAGRERTIDHLTERADEARRFGLHIFDDESRRIEHFYVVYRIITENKDRVREAFYATIERWSSNSLTRDDIATFLMLDEIGVVSISRAVHELGSIVVELNSMNWMEVLSGGRELIGPVVFRRDSRPVRLSSELRKNIESMRDDVSISSLDSMRVSSSGWMDEFLWQIQGRRTQFDYATIALAERMTSNDASAEIDADADDPELATPVEDDLTRDELACGIDAATADLNWALDTLGPPPAPMGRSAGAPSPLEPLGSEQ